MDTIRKSNFRLQINFFLQIYPEKKSVNAYVYTKYVTRLSANIRFHFTFW